MHRFPCGANPECPTSAIIQQEMEKGQDLAWFRCRHLIDTHRKLGRWNNFSHLRDLQPRRKRCFDRSSCCSPRGNSECRSVFGHSELQRVEGVKSPGCALFFLTLPEQWPWTFPSRRKDCRSHRWQATVKKPCFLDTTGQLNIWIHSNWHLDRHRLNQAPPLVGNDSCWERNGWFSLWVQPRMGWPHSRKRAHAQQYTARKTGLDGFKKNVGQVRKKLELGKVEAGSKYNQNAL